MLSHNVHLVGSLSAHGALIISGGQEQGAQLVVALTHMKLARDLKLAKNVPELDLILGGHDHEYLTQSTQPHGTLLVKSGNALPCCSVRVHPYFFFCHYLPCSCFFFGFHSGKSLYLCFVYLIYLFGLHFCNTHVCICTMNSLVLCYPFL